MKTISAILLVIISLAFIKASANDSCKIFFNKELVFSGEVEQETSVASVKTRRFSRKDCFTIIYNSENAARGWERTFYINGPADKNLKTITVGKQSGSVSVTASVLNEMKEKRQPVFIYTTSLPTDKALAARIRVRRMFICKIEWN
jgi:hypothetical protein